MRSQVIRFIEQEKVIAIVRGIPSEHSLRVAEALYLGGIRLIEWTFDQNDPERCDRTGDAIAQIADRFRNAMMVGAGTVTSPQLVQIAAEAGAQYIISPDTNPAVIEATRQQGLVSIPGAITPTEILAAHHAGADFVKLFPASAFGMAYIKAIAGPINHVKMLAVGGVNENNIAAFLAAGMCGAGVGGNLVNPAWVAGGDFDQITATATQLINAIKKTSEVDHVR